MNVPDQSRVRVRWIVLLVAAVLAGLGPRSATGQEVTGTTSLIFIPTAHLPPDGTLTFGGGYVNRRYSGYQEGAFSYNPYGVSLMFLPFLEVGMRFSRARSGRPEALGDRMLTARLRVLPEGRRRPAVLLGAQDFTTSIDWGATFFNALYVVASKRLHLSGPEGPHLDVHLGYGVDWMKAVAHQFQGVFGGIAISPAPYSELLAEYDGQTVNVGHRLTLLRRVSFLVGLQGFDTVTAGVGTRLRLR